MADVALITLHGMGERKPVYWKDLHSGVAQALGADWSRVAFQPVNYAEVLQGPQDDLWADMWSEADNDLDMTRLRKFMLFGFGDAGSLEHSGRSQKPEVRKIYLDVQALITEALRTALDDIGDPSAPVVIVAQSLGCHVISNYIWDAEKNNQTFAEPVDGDPAINDFLRLRTLRSLVTTGCNIPLFIGGLVRTGFIGDCGVVSGRLLLECLTLVELGLEGNG